jgi:hypothetical protein
MAKIKSYTDLEQSKKLAEILPLESADMHYSRDFDDRWFVDLDEYTSVKILKYVDNVEEHLLPCWSLAALLSILPNEIITDNKLECHYQIRICKYDGGDNTTLYQIAYGNNRGSSGSWHDMINTGEKESLIDCCVQMIIKLHELNLL